MPLEVHSLCAVASFLDRKDFYAFVSTCKAWSLCRYDARTVALVYVNTHGDKAPLYVAEQGLPIVHFFARQFPDKIFDMALHFIVNGKEHAPALLKPFVPDKMVVALAKELIGDNPDDLAKLLEYWDLDDKARYDLIASRLDQSGNIVTLPLCNYSSIFTDMTTYLLLQSLHGYELRIALRFLPLHSLWNSA
jgi:hypothetical protein